MRKLPLLVALGSLCLANCAGRIAAPELTADHPANPNAPEGPQSAPASALRQEAQDALRTGSREAGMIGMGHANGASAREVPSHRHGESPQAEGEATSPGANAPDDSDGSAPELSPAASEDLFTCPMHPEVVLKNPGNCPKCGMKLVKKEQELK